MSFTYDKEDWMMRIGIIALLLSLMSGETLSQHSPLTLPVYRLQIEAVEL